MNKLISWIDVDLSIAQCFALAVKTVLALFGFGIAVASVLALFQMQTRDTWISDFMRNEDILVVIISFIIAVPIEEFGFRLFPALIYRSCSGGLSARNRNIGLILVMLVSSLIFGWWHGGIPTVFTLGPIGFVFAVVFMRCGGCRGSLFRGFALSCLVHLVYNLSLLLLVRVVAE